MIKIDETKHEKIHTRQITVTTYDTDEEAVIIEGVLKDDRLMEIHRPTGENVPPGTVQARSTRHHGTSSSTPFEFAKPCGVDGSSWKNCSVTPYPVVPAGRVPGNWNPPPPGPAPPGAHSRNADQGRPPRPGGGSP